METVIVAKGECPGVEKMDGVERVISDTKPFKLSGREFRELDTIVRVGETEIGGKALSIKLRDYLVTYPPDPLPLIKDCLTTPHPLSLSPS